MSIDTPHTTICLSADNGWKREEIEFQKPELVVWSHLPTPEEDDDDGKHVTLKIGPEFGGATRFLQLSPDQARELARALNRHANEVEAYDLESVGPR